MGKPVILYGMYYNPSHGYGHGPYVDKMGVTTLKPARYNRKAIAYGHVFERPYEATSRQTDGMFFYETKEKMLKAESDAHKVLEQHNKIVERLRNQLYEAQKNRRVELERVLGKSATLPSKLGY